ncbi:MAG: hypothetical protein U1F23_02270 [Lysobacterales bacterium]
MTDGSTPAQVQALTARREPGQPTSRSPSTAPPVTNCNDSGTGSLRDAITNAADNDIIDMTHLTCSRITLTTGAFLIGVDHLFIVGPGRNDLTIDGGGIQGIGVFDDFGSGRLYLSDMTIENGWKYETTTDAKGGCIYSAGNLVLGDSSVNNCFSTAETFPYASVGGAIYTHGSTTLLYSRITNSTAESNDYATGGGIFAYGGLTSFNSQVSGNRALGTNSWGGGVFARGGSYVAYTEISGNYARNEGGAAFEDNYGVPSVMRDSTVSGNTAGSKVGGVDSRAKISIYNSTIAFNQSYYWTDGAGDFWAAGLEVNNGGSLLYSSIVSNNTIPGVGTPGDIMDLSGPVAGIGGADDIIMEFNIGVPASSDHGDPGLLPLGYNGGPTRTQIPTAVEALYGDNVANLIWDQRGPGFPRVTDGITIGAYQPNPDVIFLNGFD